MAKCPFFGLCGGCAYDFTAPDYHAKKLENLPRGINGDGAIWGTPGTRRRADFVAAPNRFGFYKAGSRDIVNVSACPNILPEINEIVPNLAALPWGCAASVLVTKCENGITVNVTSDVPYFSPEFRAAVQKLPAQIIRFTWNDNVVRAYATPTVTFDEKRIDFPDGAFLQPTETTERAIRDLVIENVAGAKRVADLFCGIGNFTFATNADGFDIAGVGVKRDLFKNPLKTRQLNQYDAVIMDPPRAGANAQSGELAASNVPRIVYISCNPGTWTRDKKTLERGGYRLKTVIPVDQFVGSTHWELFSVFEK
ncbi:MAG: class I SAM-dependent RNA methyltransferase [Alphaproteobacteria bacterium]|nr:class I SAM-dependent RNA methyltransferase [Alphaproteobacteria bacterium]